MFHLEPDQSIYTEHPTEFLHVTKRCGSGKFRSTVSQYSDSFAFEPNATRRQNHLRESDLSDDGTIIVTPSSLHRHP